MLQIERRIQQVVVLPVIAHRAGWLILDTLVSAFVACCFGSLNGLEFSGRCTDRHDVAIHSLAIGAWNDARCRARILCGGLCRRPTYKRQCRYRHSKHQRSYSVSHCSCSILGAYLFPATRCSHPRALKRKLTRLFDQRSWRDAELDCSSCECRWSSRQASSSKARQAQRASRGRMKPKCRLE